MNLYSRAELIEEMKRIALLQGEFTLRSGKTSNWYFDKYRFEGSPRIMADCRKHSIGPGAASNFRYKSHVCCANIQTRRCDLGVRASGLGLRVFLGV